MRLSGAARAGDGTQVRTGLRAARQHAGLSQQQLATAAGVTRQTVAGIESGLYGPSAAVALKIAAALGARVEDLFWLAEDPVVQARWASDADLGAAPQPGRVRLAHMPAGFLAWPVRDAHGGQVTAADGLVEPAREGGDKERTFPVRLLRQRSVLRNTVVIAGCEPALELLAQHAFVGGSTPSGRALWFELPNAAALAAVESGRAHMAAVHGVESPGAGVDLGLEQPMAPPPGYRVFHLVRTRQGWLFDPSRPFQGVSDLTSGRLRIINRQHGSGARALLDRALRKASIDTSRVPGYDQVAGGHLELAAAIASGAADVGVGLERAALAHGLGFLPLQEERCDLWVPRAHCELPAVVELLSALGGGAFRADLSAIAPYDTADTGVEATPHPV